jgi:hypothetical protein
MTWSAGLALLGRALAFCIPVPVIAIAALAGWLWWDRTSAVRQAVDNAVTELVAGGEIAALKAELAAAERARNAAEAANANFARRLAADAAAERDEETEHVAHDAQNAFGGDPWPLRQPDIDWLRK